MQLNYQVNVSESDVQIIDSCFVSKNLFETILNDIRSNYTSAVLDNRSNFSIKMEWACHNLLYDLNIQRDRTKDVDFEYPVAKWYYPILYTLGGLLAYIFIK